MNPSGLSDREALIRILQDAYSGELAAALAYRGHWKSVRDPAQKEMIRTIEAEEWDHRDRVGRMMRELGVGPVRRREIRRGIIGRVISIGCHMVGWFIPMYFAGRLEGQNICAYDVAAPFARSLGLEHFERELLAMADVERRHEDVEDGKRRADVPEPGAFGLADERRQEHDAVHEQERHRHTKVL